MFVNDCANEDCDQLRHRCKQINKERETAQGLKRESRVVKVGVVVEESAVVLQGSETQQRVAKASGPTLSQISETCALVPDFPSLFLGPPVFAGA